jgi:hypothetical protein
MFTMMIPLLRCRHMADTTVPTPALRCPRCLLPPCFADAADAARRMPFYPPRLMPRYVSDARRCYAARLPSPGDYATPIRQFSTAVYFAAPLKAHAIADILCFAIFAIMPIFSVFEFQATALLPRWFSLRQEFSPFSPPSSPSSILRLFSHASFSPLFRLPFHVFASRRDFLRFFS